MTKKHSLYNTNGTVDIPGCCPLFYAYNLASLSMKNFTSATPLN